MLAVVDCNFDDGNIEPSFIQYPITGVGEGLDAHAIGVASATALVMAVTIAGTVITAMKLRGTAALHWARVIEATDRC